MADPKLTPTQIKALEALEASDDFLPSWNVPGPISVLDKLCQKRLVELRDRTMMTQPTKARITEAGRQALASLRAEESAKEASARAKPLSVFERKCLCDMEANGVYRKDNHNTWKISDDDMAYGTIIMHKLIARGLFKKINDNAAQMTTAGRDISASLKKEATNG